MFILIHVVCATSPIWLGNTWKNLKLRNCLPFFDLSCMAWRTPAVAPSSTRPVFGSSFSKSRSKDSSFKSSPSATAKGSPLQEDFSHDTWDKPSSLKKSALVDPDPQSTRVTGSIGCTSTVGSTGCGSWSSGSCFNNFHPLLGRVRRTGRARRGTCRAAAAPAESTPGCKVWWSDTVRQLLNVLANYSWLISSL